MRPPKEKKTQNSGTNYLVELLIEVWSLDHDYLSDRPYRVSKLFNSYPSLVGFLSEVRRLRPHKEIEHTS